MIPGDITGPRNYEQFPSVPREKTIWGTESVSCNIIALKKGNYFLFFLKRTFLKRIIRVQWKFNYKTLILFLLQVFCPLSTWKRLTGGDDDPAWNILVLEAKDERFFISTRNCPQLNFTSDVPDGFKDQLPQRNRSFHCSLSNENRKNR